MRNRLIAVVLLAGTACSGSSNSSYSTGPNNDPTPTAANTVNANPALDFNPASLTVTHGTTVTFVFGSVGHNVTFTTAGAPANVATSQNTSAQVAFPTAGTFAYHCTIHANMNGVVIVQ